MISCLCVAHKHTPHRAFSGSWSFHGLEVANLVHKAMGAVVIPLPLQAISEEGWVSQTWGAPAGQLLSSEP